jgi:hypothetical protein
MDSLFTFLNSSFGVMLGAVILGAIGVFTWQKWDWQSKEQYHQTQVFLDRKLDLIDKINRDVGKFVALAASISAPILKGSVSEEETTESIQTFNEYQSSWFGECKAFKAALTFYFNDEVVDAFVPVIDATGNLDYALKDVRTKKGADQAYKAGLAVFDVLRELNLKALKEIKPNGHAKHNRPD